MLSVLQVQQMVCPSYLMGKLKGMGGFLCKMPDSHGSTVIRRKNSKNFKQKNPWSGETLLLHAETHFISTAWLLSCIVFADSTARRGSVS